MTQVADIWFHNTLAAHFTRDGDQTTFHYRDDYSGPPIATSLPVSADPVITRSGAIPPFFAGLLPEGRRLSSLRRNIKASADDELSLLLEVGADPVGAVSIFPHGESPRPAEPIVPLEGEADFSLALNDSGITDPVALAGVQDKASARTIALPISSDAILKLSPPEFPFLVENEAACYRLISKNKLRIELSKVEVVHDKHGRSGLLVHRFDRTPQGKYPVEDAGQVLGIWPADKYSVSYEDIADALSKVCASPLLAMRNLAFQIAVAWLSGNGDLHAKNISIMNKGRGFEISPIYDIPSTAVYGDTTMALEIQGSRKDLSKKKFLSFCASVGLPQKTAASVVQAVLSATENAAETILHSGDFSQRTARDLTRVLHYRRKTWLD